MRAVTPRLQCTALGQFATFRLNTPLRDQGRPASFNSSAWIDAAKRERGTQQAGLRPVFLERLHSFALLNRQGSDALPLFNRQRDNVLRVKGFREMSASSTSREPRFKALTVDIGGTFLKTAVPVAEAYASIGKKYGVTATPEDIKKGFKAAFAKPWPERLRYEGDGRPFWRHAVATATGCSDADYFEELYMHYSRGDAWKVEDGAQEAMSKLKAEGVKLAVVSNFDTRLRPVLNDLGVSNLFDAIIVSAEVGHEKPAVEIFQAALLALKASTPSDAAHIGDDRTADVEGAQAAGMQAWLWKEDVKTFDELVSLVL